MLFFFFGGYIFLIPCVCAIRKKLRTKKENTFFWSEVFYLSRGEREGEVRETRKEKTRKGQYTHRSNSNLPGESIAREKERVLLFINSGKSPLFYKKQYRKPKSEKRSITLKKNLNLGKKLKLFLSCNAKEKTNA